MHEMENSIALPLVKKIFSQNGIDQHFSTFLENYSPTLAHNYYPRPVPGLASKLPAHIDTILITVLFIREPGLQVYHKEEWRELNPLDGHAVVILGKTLELMTGKGCSPALHRVHPPAETDRVVITVYLRLNPTAPIIDYKNGEQVYPNSKEFFKAEATVIYPEE